MPVSVRCFILLTCLALSGCEGETFSDRVHQADDDWLGGSCGSSKGSKAEQEAKDRQCRADQTQARVDRQQVIHDQGMSIPLGW